MANFISRSAPVFFTILLLAGCSGEVDDAIIAEKTNARIGYIPIADHVLVGISDIVDGESFENLDLDPLRFTNYPTMSEALRSGDIDGAFLLAPLAFQIKLTGTPVKLVLLGHRDGSGLVVDSEKDFTDIGSLANGTVAIPHRFATNNFLLHMYASEAGVQDEIDTVEAGPPEMFAALNAKSIDGYITAEPFISEAEESGVGEVMVFTSEIWEGHPDCVLVLREDFIANHPEAVQELIDSMVRAAERIEMDRAAAVPLVTEFLGKTEALWRIALLDPRRVTFHNLIPEISELERMQNYMATEMGLFPTRVDLSELIDSTFAERAYARLESDGN